MGMKYISASFLAILTLLSAAQAAENLRLPAEKLHGDGREYYINAWNYAFNHKKAGETYHWDSHSAKGDIVVGAQYVSKSQATCRNFSESFVIGAETGSNQGVACKRDDGKGWCKLKMEDARTCALEEPQGFVDKMVSDTQRWWVR